MIVSGLETKKDIIIHKDYHSWLEDNVSTPVVSNYLLYDRNFVAYDAPLKTLCSTGFKFERLNNDGAKITGPKFRETF